ncbi:hypothetical protein [Streptomyces sp. Wh19]|uniref:hypothetical protein n=1 Tax=Streptomyces sp. Wh19 TaxID=3076629 RepID=UPI00295834F6|nr:hypothetical protein [Streptomyces sp. Wh19]
MRAAITTPRLRPIAVTAFPTTNTPKAISSADRWFRPLVSGLHDRRRESWHQREDGHELAGGQGGHSQVSSDGWEQACDDVAVGADGERRQANATTLPGGRSTLPG